MGLLDSEHGPLPVVTSILVVSRTSLSFSLVKGIEYLLAGQTERGFHTSLIELRPLSNQL